MSNTSGSSDLPRALRSFADFCRLVPTVAWQLEAVGIDSRGSVAKLARAFFPDEARSMGLLNSDLLTDSSRDDLITSRYRQLESMDESSAEYVRVLADLRALQQAEADEFRRNFEARRLLDPDAARHALARADELIAAHADPATSD